jgi:predicted ATPase
VGREGELETLRRTLEQAGSGHGQLVALVGEPGVGKSRLVWEFSHSHRTQGWLMLETRSVSYGKATSYLPVIDLLKSYYGIEVRDDPRRMREKLTGKLLTLDPALQPTLPAFQALLDLPVGDAAWEALDPPRRRQQTLDALKRWVLRESQEQPVLLVFEDLHWIDSETQALLDSLVESLPTARILLLVNYRPEYAHGWAQKTYYQQLRLDPLPATSAEELLVALLGNDDSLEGLRRLLIERTEGNPFFLEESVRSLVETSVLVGERGAYRLSRATAGTQVPATVQAVLAARIDRLEPEDKRLLQCAAVIGKDVPYPLLQAIAELPEPALRPALARLQAAEFLYETNLYPNLEYTFKHALTHEVTYGSLLQDRRRALHARIVERIEERFADRLAEQVERLAHHAERGEVWEKAVVYLRQAGVKTVTRSAHREAVAYFEGALEALQHLPPSRARLEQAFDLRFDLRSSLVPIGEHAQVISHLQEAETLADALGDSRRSVQVFASMANHLWLTGHHDDAARSGQRALALAMTLGDAALQLQANFRLSHAYYALGDYRAASAAAETCVDLTVSLAQDARFGLTGVASVASRSWLTMCRAAEGQFAEGIVHGAEAVRIAEIVADPFSLILALLAVGSLKLERGILPAAVATLERAVDVCQARQIPLWLPWVVSCLGYAYALAGRLDKALPLLVGHAAITWGSASTAAEPPSRR